MVEIPDDRGLAGRVAVVTGGGAAGDGIGNGRAAALLFARGGARVTVVDRDAGLAERTVEMIREIGGDAVAIGADVTSEDDCARVVATAVERFGRLDFLDNNVGVDSTEPVARETREGWDRVMAINTTAMFLMTKHAAPAMREAGGGAIVNIASIAALRPRGMTAYSTSKGAVIALTTATAVDLAPDGTRVNCVVPGPVYTPMVSAHGMSDTAREARRRASPLGIEGTGWDVGHAVVFLCSAHARYITGQALCIDGGATIVGPARDYNT